MAKARKAPEFNDIGDELNFQTAFIQASAALDLAGYHAQEKQDTETLTTVAAMYIKMGEILMQPVHGSYDEDEEEDEDVEKQPLGFRPYVVPDIVPDEEAVELEKDDENE